MDENLAPAFAWLKGLGAALCHYKVCSTFDSSPGIGNIGRAIEIGRRVFGQASVPVLVGAPQLKRYTVFGNLFAGYRGETYRIDRHPVMSRHPVTPMHEADLLRHLAAQTSLTSSLVDLAQLASAGIVDRAVTEKEIVLFDVADAETQRLAGEALWRIRERAPFAVGSSGVEYALLAAWQATGTAPKRPQFAVAGPVDRIAVVSGSVSPTTERQIRHATANGFDGIALDPVALLSDPEREVSKALYAGEVALSRGRSVILYTALGTAADRGAEIDRHAGARHELARTLGRILKHLASGQKLKRVVIAGGDTSSHALGELGVEALTIRMPLPQSPGSPLCVAHAADFAVDGLEIALKGGQVGKDDYFSGILAGRPD
jgi:uncharacterized protein YgbK (DUF1537 family)